MIEDLKQEHFNLKLEGTLEDHLSCEITFNDDETVSGLDPSITFDSQVRAEVWDFSEQVAEL